AFFFSGGNQALGGFIYNVSLTKKDKKYFAELLLSREFPHFKIKTGMEMYLASSPLVNQELKKSYADKQKWKRLPVTAYLRGKINEKLSLTFTDRDGNQAVAHNDTLLERAEKNPISIEFTRKEIAALSGTPFVLDEFRDLRVEVDMDAFIPHKTLKELRQKVSETLINMRIMKNAPAFGEKQPENIDSILKNRYKISNQKQSVENPRLHILVRNLLQLDQVLNFKNKKPDTIYLDLTYGYEYRDAVIKIKNHGMKAGLTTARVYKPGEETQLKKIMESNPDTILVRNAASLHYLKNKFLNLVGDFSLNITNQKSAEFFCSKGLGRITPSHDLISDSGKTQDPAILFEFLNSFPSDMVEINILYYLSSFYMEYCLFSKYLSNGKSSAQCGYPCTKHNLALKDRKGEIHPVIADRNCRNEMFNGRPKNLANYIPQFLDKGVKNFRIEMSPDVKNMDYDLKKIEAIYNYF
ncbi:MAG: DUF3656 domain-containing protein, partial [Spirochaetia bacterium]|nr:DUF3656 domain-containing protein [Spirochaetia bacterium]